MVYHPRRLRKNYAHRSRKFLPRRHGTEPRRGRDQGYPARRLSERNGVGTAQQPAWGRGCLFFKKTVEGCACIVGATRLRNGGRDLMRTVARLGGGVACDGDARLEQRASVGLVLDRYSYCDVLQALEAR